jgi:hypothetical protein
MPAGCTRPELDTVAIQQNLSHANLKMSLGYIGTLDGDRWRPTALYSFELEKMKELEEG